MNSRNTLPEDGAWYECPKVPTYGVPVVAFARGYKYPFVVVAIEEEGCVFWVEPEEFEADTKYCRTFDVLKWTYIPGLVRRVDNVRE